MIVSSDGEGNAVTVQAAYMHCAKVFMRSKLWKPDTWPDRGTLPTLGEIFRDQLAVDDTAEQAGRRLDRAYKETLW
ncbi:PNPOx family protein [Glycomyces tarimensis]